jgi:hypothetical protein
MSPSARAIWARPRLQHRPVIADYGAFAQTLTMRTNQWIRASILAAGLIAAWVVAHGAQAQGTTPGCPRSVVPSARQERTAVQDLVVQVDRAVPRVYGAMTNQKGRGASRGYLIEEMVSLAPIFPVWPEVRRLRAPAVRRCGAPVADHAWAVTLAFPNAQTIPASKSLAYFVHESRGWRFWFRKDPIT